ncbi:unnamed protein product, partial [Anisakis simplex]|uniref:Uncharacterized protein n=1 Tax=Anisakis simplex TaxID=6269 RepID=A0A0M3JGB6_ANISI
MRRTRIRRRCDKHSYAGPPPSPMHFNNVSSSPPPVNNKKLSVPTIPRTNPFHRIQTPLKQPMPDPRELSQSNNSVSASSSDQLEYFDP